MRIAEQRPSLSLRPPRRLRHAFSLMEVVTLIALLGVITVVAVNVVGGQPVAISNTKLTSDVATLNRVIALYLADGGSLTGVNNPQAVLDKLKRTRPPAEWPRHTGPVTGRLVDTRLRARMSGILPGDGRQRAKWNSQTSRFELTSGGGSAVTEFYLDPTLTQTDFGTEARAMPKVRYNVNATGKNQGWIWGSSATGNIAYATPGSTTQSGQTGYFDPAEPAPTVPAGGGGGGGGDGGAGGGGDGGGGGTPVATALPRPTISPATGTFSYATFPTSVAISPNGTPGTGTRLEYRVNGGAWQEADGSAIAISPASTVEARNVAVDTTLYSDSQTSSATYYRLAQGFTGTASGTFGNATGGSNLVTEIENGAGTSSFKHGNTKLDLGNGEYLDAGVENVLSFTPETIDAVLPNTWFDLAELGMLNGTTFYDSEADGVTLSINLNLTQPAHTGVVHVSLGLISTENSGDAVSSADIVELRNPSTDFRVTIDGVEYRLELSWATLDPAAGTVQGNQFLVFEGQAARAALRGRLVSNH